jgi:hypothetical protein
MNPIFPSNQAIQTWIIEYGPNVHVAAVNAKYGDYTVWSTSERLTDRLDAMSMFGQGKAKYILRIKLKTSKFVQ